MTTNGRPGLPGTAVRVVAAQWERSRGDRRTERDRSSRPGQAATAHRGLCGVGPSDAARVGARAPVREFVRSAVLSAAGLCPVARRALSDRLGGTGRVVGVSRTLWRRFSPWAGARCPRWRSDIGTGVRAERGVVGGKSLPRRPQRIVRSPWRDRAGRQRIADLVAPVFPVRRYPQPAPAPRHRHGIAGPRPGTRTGVRPARGAGPPPPRPVTPRTPLDRPGVALRNPAAAPRVSLVDGPHIGLKASPEPGIATMGTPEPDRGTRIAHEESSWQTRPSP